MTFTVAIAGRPNVGKSTLFNRLVGRKLAIVDDTPGVTRDWRAAEARLGGLEFTAIDTAGLEEAFGDSLEGRLRRQTERALERADVVLLLIDGRAGVTPLDRHFAGWLREQGRPVVVVANKCEGSAGLSGQLDAFELGLGEPVGISAEHGEGMADLVEALLPYAPPDPVADDDFGEAAPAEDGDPEAVEDGIGPERPLRLAIVGRPNVGKSTLLNRLVGEERVLTGPEPGMTRDAISVDWHWQDRWFRLVDTAGLRRRARVDEKLERLAVAETLRVVRLAHVVLLVVDAAAILDRQDLTIARLVVDEGRGLVIAVNKWDAVEDRTKALAQLSDRLQTSLSQARGVATATVSALTGQGIDAMLAATVATYQVWNRRIPTAQLNRWLEQATAEHSPPLVDGRRIKLRYMTQVKARPPTFALWVSKPVDLPEAYQRYLVAGLRDRFTLPGVPLRLLLRKSRNPYAEG
ncbi:MAG: ribosome biogenesis GTPase Der [Azospirillum sp.]|nr:ribosome biogenesis GTPase Der [Azospirillum sp.]